MNVSAARPSKRRAVCLRRTGLELAVPVAELRQVEGLTVGGLREVPVRW
ncbi:hypothetical protein GCM10022245_62530 [Streptomyces mayteni]